MFGCLQVCIAALDCCRIDVSNECVNALKKKFPGSQRVMKLQVRANRPQFYLCKFILNIEALLNVCGLGVLPFPCIPCCNITIECNLPSRVVVSV